MLVAKGKLPSPVNADACRSRNLKLNVGMVVLFVGGGDSSTKSYSLLTITPSYITMDGECKIVGDSNGARSRRRIAC